MGLNDIHVWTDSDYKLISWTLTGCALPGMVLSFIVLCAYGFVAMKPRVRPYLDRVSFRLLTYAMVTNIAFGIAFVLTAWLVGPSAGCSFIAFLTNTTLLLSATIFFCIALNLQLVIVHGVNGNMMEKYYIIGSFVFALALNIPVYAQGHYGWNVQNATCWYNDPDDKRRLRTIIAQLSFWILFIATAETVMFFVVLVHMVRAERNSRTFRLDSHVSSRVSNIKSATNFASRYRKIILRIGLYPLVSCVMNFSTVALDLYQTVVGVNTNLQFNLSLLDLSLYGIRLFFYAALAATDPSFLKAVRALRNPSSISGTTAVSGMGTGRHTTTTQGQLTVHIELAQMKSTDDGVVIGSAVDKDAYGNSYIDLETNGKDSQPEQPSVNHSTGDVRPTRSVEVESQEAINFQRQI
jgi:hypothetical protein